MHGCIGKSVVQVIVVYVGDLIMNCELGTLGMCVSGGSGVDFPELPPGLVAVVEVDELVVDEDILLILLADVVTPNLRSRIFSSHSSQPCLGLFRLRC